MMHFAAIEQALCQFIHTQDQKAATSCKAALLSTMLAAAAHQTHRFQRLQSHLHTDTGCPRSTQYTLPLV